MSGIIDKINLFGRSEPTIRDTQANEALRALKDLEREDVTTKTPSQLERVLFDMQTNLSALLKCLSSGASAVNMNDRKLIGVKAEYYMGKAESIKAVIKVKKEQREKERRRRNSRDAASLQEETRRRLGNAKLEELG